MIVVSVPGPAIIGMARGKTLTSSRLPASRASRGVSRAPDWRPKEHVYGDEEEQHAARQAEGRRRHASALKIASPSTLKMATTTAAMIVARVTTKARS